MTKSGYIIGVILMVTLTVTTVNGALKCWRCNTDVSNSDFCKDPFDGDRSYDNNNYNNYNNYNNNYNNNNRLFSLVNCTNPHNVLEYNMGNKRPACQKFVREIYGKTIISRSCVLIDIGEPSDKCFYDVTDGSPVRVKYCETCLTDGCNGASGIMPIVSIILMPALIAKILMV